MIDRLIALAEMCDAELAIEARAAFPPPKHKQGKRDERIDELISYAKTSFGISYDGTGKDRFACTNFFNAFAKEEQFKNDDPVTLVKQLIDAALKDRFWSGQITNLTSLYSKRGRIINLLTAGTGQPASQHQYAATSADALARKLADRGN